MERKVFNRLFAILGVLACAALVVVACAPERPQTMKTDGRGAGPPVSATRESAVSWAEYQYQSKVTRFVDSDHPNGENWYGWCLKFVANAFGQPAAGHGSAYELYQELVKKGQINTGQPTQPGVLVFWNWTGEVNGETKNWGHVAIYVDDNKVISTPFKDGAPIMKRAINEIKLDGYLGYSQAPEDW